QFADLIVGDILQLDGDERCKASLDELALVSPIGHDLVDDGLNDPLLSLVGVHAARSCGRNANSGSGSGIMTPCFAPNRCINATKSANSVLLSTSRSPRSFVVVVRIGTSRMPLGLLGVLGQATCF